VGNPARMQRAFPGFPADYWQLIDPRTAFRSQVRSSAYGEWDVNLPAVLVWRLAIAYTLCVKLL